MEKPLTESLKGWLTEPVRISDELSFTLLSVFLGAVLFVLLFTVAGWVRRFFDRRILPRLGLAVGVRAVITNLLGYLILFLGTLVILPVIFPGFNLSTLVVIAGGLSLGIGFGLRNVADNFFSGLVLLIEQPIKVGDRIIVQNLHGTVISIRARSTTVRTNDNIDIIVPNAHIINHEIVNLSHSDTRVRFKIPIGVHYKTDVYLAEKALLEAAAACPNVIQDPPPAVRFLEFGDSSLNLELRVWTDTLHDRPNVLRSEVNFRIWETFRQHGINIPYPQRDLHIISHPDSKPPSPASR